jgi:UDP-glucuronate decarboxylase
LAQLVIELTGSRSKLTRRELPVDDPIQRCPDISQAEQLLKWQPKTPLRQGLTRTIQYFDQLLRKFGATQKQPVTS